MIEMIIRPRKAERRPWEMFFVGLFYASIAVLIVSFVFSKDSVLSQYSGILLITLTVMCSLPFMYFIIRLEEGKDVQISEEGKLIKEHSKAVFALMWLFLGFVVAFSFFYLAMPTYTSQSFDAQIKTYCAINNPSNFDFCTKQNGINNVAVTGNVAKVDLFLNIFVNNVWVLIFTLIFSLAFGAGAIFVLAWNASVIAAAIGIFSKNGLIDLPMGLARYMIHGIPEIAAYFVGALAGGIISVAIIRKDLRGEKMWTILQDSLIMILIAVVILLLAGLVEVYITPKLF